MFVSTAYAMAPPPGAEGSTMESIMSFFPLILLVAIFYFFLFRPQQKKQKELQQLVDGLKEGDSILTTGGLYGTVTKVKDEVITLQVAEGVRVKVNRHYVVSLKNVVE
jgi:preprotein translocase subunit YajC